jgi:hypothetical protein
MALEDCAPAADGVAEARRLRGEGLSWQAVTQRLGHSPDYWRRRLDPVWAEQNREKKNRAQHARIERARRSEKPPHGGRGMVVNPITDEQLRAYRAAIPADTRTWFEKAMGDPSPFHLAERDKCQRKGDQGVKT